MRSNMSLILGLVLGLLVGAVGGYVYADRMTEANINLMESTQPETSMETASPSSETTEETKLMGGVTGRVGEVINSDWKIFLNAQNNSGEAGVVSLTEENGKTKVLLLMAGNNTAGPQPAHIHAGACPNPGAVKYPLTNVVNDVSETVIDTTIANLKKMEI